METSKKRKRDIDYPRITYDVADRTFDRLFKEESLGEMKQVVRKKMGYSSDVPLHLAQLRDGKTVDLEDDDDFDAFCAATYAVPVIVVRVTVGKPTIGPIAAPERSEASQAGAGAFAAQTDEDNDELSSRVPKSAKKRKMSRNSAPSGEKKAISKDTAPINGSEATCETGATTDSVQKKGVERANAGGEKKRKRKKDSDEAEPPQEKSKKKKAKAADHDATTSEAALRSTGPPEATTSELPQDVRAASNVAKPEKLKKSKNNSSAVVEVSGDEAELPDDRLANPLQFAAQLAEVITRAAASENKKLPMPSEELLAKKKRGKNEKEVKPINRNKSTLEPSSQSKNKVAASETNDTTEGEMSNSKGKSKSSARETETSLGKKDAKASLQKIMARRGIPTSDVASKTPAQEPAALRETENAVVKASRPPKVKVTEVQPNGVKPLAGKRPSRTQSCPICKESPLHLRFQCPIVVRGVEALETRLAELQEDTSEDQSQLIGELKMMIERKRKTKKPKTKVVSDNSTTLPGSSKVATVVKAPQVDGKISTLKGLPVPGALSALGSVPYTDLDLEAIIRGPRVSLTAANIPSTDTSEDEEERDESKAEGLLEDEEVVVKVKYPRKRLSSESSDEDEDEDEEDETNKPVDTPRQSYSPLLVNTTASEPRRSPSSGGSDNGDRSFMDVDGQGESVEVDNTGDAAFSEALADDTAVFKAVTDNRPPEAHSERHQTDDDSDTAVASQKNEGNSAVPVPNETTGNARNDSAELVETPESPEAPHSPIIGSSQTPPLQSTPKLSQSMRTRARQLLAKSGASSGQPPTTRAMKLLSSIHEGNGPSLQGNEDSFARRTRTATKSLSQLPMPALSARVIKSPLATQPHPQAQEEEEEEEDGESPAAVPNPSQSSVLAGKTPAKPSPKAPANTKARAKTPAKAPPKTAAKGSKPARKASARGRGKANDVDREEANTFDADINGEDSHVPEQASLNTWEVLNDNSSQVGDITMMMEDELQSSPSTRTPLPKFANGQSTKESEHEPSSQEDNRPSTTKEPLFILTESQPGFPYSQWATGQGPESANDSEDEEEVAAVVKPQLARQMASHSFRRLTDITASQQLFQAPITMQPSQLASSKHTSNDPYGRKGKESESEESDTESDSDQDTPTHIPKERRAGRVKA